MPREDFEKLIEEGFEKLPKWVRTKIENVALLVEDEPTDDVIREQGFDPETDTLLGLYRGIPRTARGDMYGVGMTLPDTITLYQFPIEDAADEDVGEEASDEIFAERVREIVAETVWHEFAHYFGMDEDMVQAREKDKHDKEH